MQIVTGRRGEPHVTSRQMQAVYRSFLGDFALLDIGEKLRAEAYSNDIVRVYDGVVSVQGIYAVIAYNQYDEVYIEPVSVGKKRIDTIVLHYTKDNTLDVEDMQLDVVRGEEYTDNPIAPVVPEGGDAWEGTTDIQVPIYDVEVTNFGLTVTPYARMLNLIPTLESIAERIPETVVTGVKGDSEVLYRDGDVNITKANIGLGNVDNTADTDKPISIATQTALNLKADLVYVNAVVASAYHAGGNLTVAELTSALLITENMGKVYNMSDSGVTTADFVEGAGKPIREGDDIGICNRGTDENPIYKFNLLSGFVDLSAYATTSAMNTALAGKVDKVDGKGLSTEDYTTTDKTKLAGISEGATQTIANPADTATETLSKVEIEGTVYDIPQGASGATELSELIDVNLSNVGDNDILQYDETANKWKNSNALQGAKTATGNPITITDAAPVNAVNLSMDLEPIQDLHGYDHPWVGGAGKNKLPMTVDGIKRANTSGGTWSGNVFTIDGLTITIQTDSDNNVIGILANGKNTTGDTNFNIAQIADTATMKLVGCPSDGDFSTKYSLYVLRSYARGNDSGNGLTFAFETGDWIKINIRQNVQCSNILFKPMVSTDTTITYNDFSSYSNICPISGRSEVAIERVGKNLANSVTAKSTTSRYAGVCYAKIDNFKPLTTYTISFEGTGGNRLYPNEYLFSGGYSPFTVVNGRNTLTVTTLNEIDITQYSEDGWSLLKNAQNQSSANVFNNFQLELGSTATTYEPYAGKTYTIQFGQTVYGGRLDVTRGKMVVDTGYATITTLGRNAERSYWATISNAKPGFNIICNKEKTAINSFAIGVFVNDSGSFRINTEASYSSASECINAYGGSLDICYELATPFTIDLTPQQIKLLENTNTIYTNYEGDTITIEYQPNNAIGEAVRAVEESYDPEFAVRPVLKKIALSGTTSNVGIYENISLRNIIPVFFKDNYGYTFLFRGASVLSFRVIGDSNEIKTNYNFSGVLYYYELEG